jgi:hypothetical protein
VLQPRVLGRSGESPVPQPWSIFAEPVKVGNEWYVLARHPSGQHVHVRRFKTQSENLDLDQFQRDIIAAYVGKDCYPPQARNDLAYKLKSFTSKLRLLDPRWSGYCAVDRTRRRFVQMVLVADPSRTAEGRYVGRRPGADPSGPALHRGPTFASLRTASDGF